MKKLLSLTFTALAFVCAVSCGGRHNISAHIEGAGDAVVVHARGMNEIERTDTIRTDNGRFVYDIPESMSEPVFVSIISESDIYSQPSVSNFNPDAESIELLMSHGDRISIKGVSVPDGMAYTVKGSGISPALAAHHNEFLPLHSRKDSLYIEILKVYALPETDDNERLAEALFAEREKYSDKINLARKKYVRENPDSELSAFYAAQYAGRDSMEHYMSIVNPRVMEGFLKPYMESRRRYLAEYKEYVRNRETVTEGADAPAFSLSDRNGNTVSLADIESEYIVLDFWGSWCGYCIAGFPKMKEYHGKYGNKVGFVGIDCRDSYGQWIAALDKYELPWMQLIDNPDDKTSVKYAVAGYPTKILIGADRKIISIFLGESDEFYRKLDELFK